MDFPRYQFSENATADLAEFLKLAKVHKQNSYCKEEEYNRLIKFFPLTLKENHKEAAICIDITESDTDSNDPVRKSNCINELSLDKVNTPNHALIENSSSLNDLQNMLKGCLTVEKSVSKDLLLEVAALSSGDSQKLFSCLIETLSMEDISSFWYSIIINEDIPKEDLVTLFIRDLFFPNIKLQHSFEYRNILMDISNKYPEALKNKLIEHISEAQWNDEDGPIIIQYVSSLTNDYKADVLCGYLTKSDRLTKNHISFVETLLNQKVSNEILFQLVVLMASSSGDFTKDNTFGKLLYKVVGLFDAPVSGLEQPLRQILGSHESIWRIKVERSVNGWFNDTLTQSFL